MKEGTATVRVDFAVLGWACRWVGLPTGETTVPQIRTVAGETVTSTSHLRIASTSPIRAEVPSITSMIGSSWPSGLRARESAPPPPVPHGPTDRLDLGRGQGHRRRRRLAQPGRVAHRVLRDRVVAHREPQGEAQDRARLLGVAVALVRGQRLEVLVDLAHGDLAQRVVLEGGHHQLAHVALVERSGAGGERVLQVEVGEPDLDQRPERGLRADLAGGDVAGALGERPLEVVLGLDPGPRRWPRPAGPARRRRGTGSVPGPGRGRP